MAVRALGDAHVLGGRRPVATLVLPVLRHARVGDPALLEQAESVRSQRTVQRVLANELARPALFLDLPRYDSCEGEPSYRSSRALLRRAPTWAVTGRDVFVCENPNVVTLAADVLGADCAPLVCTDGMPVAAQRALLAQLAAASARLRHHGEFDWPGIAIANVVMRAFGATAWRFNADDYYLAAARACALSERRLDAPGRDAVWNNALKNTMLACGVPIDEEAVAVT